MVNYGMIKHSSIFFDLLGSYIITLMPLFIVFYFNQILEIKLNKLHSLSSYIIISMSIFSNGDFKIQNSWDRRPASKQSHKSRNNSHSRDKNSLRNAARQILQPSPDIIDKEMASKIFKQFQAEMPPLPMSCRSQKKIPGNRDGSRDIIRDIGSRDVGIRDVGSRDVGSRGVGSREGSRNKLPPRQKTNGNGNDDLLTSMASRLRQTEQLCTNLKKQLKQKNDLIDKLKNQNTFVKAFRQDSDGAYKKYQLIQSKNKALQDKVKQMQEYLKKYGMKWVGNGKIQGKLDQKQLKKDIANGKHNYRLPSEIDIGTIQRRVEELNAGLHSEGHGTQIYVDNGIHKFRKAQPLPIAFFGDGIAIKGFNFYPYKSKQSLKVLSDLVDGYFPYVLKGKYPNGVFLKVVDMISEKYSNQQNSEKIISFDGNTVNKNQFQPPSKDQFLKKLPKQIIKNGKIIPIRAEIQKKLDGVADQKQQQHKQCCQLVDGCYVFKTAVHTQLQNQQVSQEEVCTLKIRTEEGKICILELQPNSQVSQVYKWMKHIVKSKFKLMGNYPKRSYEEQETKNLEDLDLTPNAILHIQAVK